MGIDLPSSKYRIERREEKRKGPCKVRNETETKRNETKQIETKRNKSKRNETDRNETKQIETKRNKTKRNKSKRNETSCMERQIDICSLNYGWNGSSLGK